MAKDTTKAPKVDLDGDEKLRDYGDQTPFLPFGEGEYDVSLTAFVYHDGYKGQAYRAKVKIEKSDRADVKAGKIYCLHFPIEGNKEQKQQKLKELRSFVAAVMGANPADKDFSGNDAIATLVEAHNEEALDGMGLHVSCRDKEAVDKETKEPIKNKKGEQVVYTNRFYSPREAA